MNQLLYTCRVGPGVKTHPESKCPELLANYCDMLLRKTPLSKKLTSEEIEGKLRDVVSIYSIAVIHIEHENVLYSCPKSGFPVLFFAKGFCLFRYYTYCGYCFMNGSHSQKKQKKLIPRGNLLC